MCIEYVFPAHAGMNRLIILALKEAEGVPRPRGDEPTSKSSCSRLGECSPPTRG